MSREPDDDDDGDEQVLKERLECSYQKMHGAVQHTKTLDMDFKQYSASLLTEYKSLFTLYILKC